MTFEEIIKTAYDESVNNIRKGDKDEELKAIQNHIKSCKKIVVPNHNNVKTSAINDVLRKYDINLAENLYIHTNTADLTRSPTISKAQLALDTCDCDLVIARGRLGVPGSGSMLVLMDNKGRILSASISPPHVLHGKELENAVGDELTEALERIGFELVK